MANFLYSYSVVRRLCFKTPSQEPFWPRRDYFLLNSDPEFLCYVLHRPQKKFDLIFLFSRATRYLPGHPAGFFLFGEPFATDHVDAEAMVLAGRPCKG